MGGKTSIDPIFNCDLKKKIRLPSEKGNKPREMEIGVFMIYFVINLLNCVVTAAVFYFNCWGVGNSKKRDYIGSGKCEIVFT